MFEIHLLLADSMFLVYNFTNMHSIEKSIRSKVLYEFTLYPVPFASCRHLSTHIPPSRGIALCTPCARPGLLDCVVMCTRALCPGLMECVYINVCNLQMGRGRALNHIKPCSESIFLSNASS